jgi:hypothetical protein
MGSGTEPSGEYTYGKGNENHELGTGVFFLRVRDSYRQLRRLGLLVIGCHIVLRGCWCHIIVLNIHAPTEEKTDDVKDSFYEECERMFVIFCKYHMKILLRDCNAKEGREDIFKPKIGNESLHEISNDNGVNGVDNQ